MRYVGTAHQDAIEARQRHRRGEQADPGRGVAGIGTGPDADDARPEEPSQVYTLVVFESEEQARAREQDPRRQEQLQAARAMMAGIFDGPPQFTDLTVDDEWTG